MVTMQAASKSTDEFGTMLDVPIDEAIERTTAALKAEGFGVLTKIDVKATLNEKIGEAFYPYTILGACNPRLAHQALTTNPDIGLLLPCNVIVYELYGRTTVNIINPEIMLGSAPENPELSAIAAEAAERLRRVALALKMGSTA